MTVQSRWLFCFVGWAGLAMLVVGSATPGQGQQKKTIVIQGVEAVRYYVGRNEFDKAEDYANRLLFSDIHQPEVLDLLVRSLDAQKKREPAAVMATWLLRVLEKASPQDVAKYKTATEKKLAVWNKDFDELKAKYPATAPKYDAPEKVADLWMTQIKADLTSPHALYAYDLVGGRKYTEPEHVVIASKGVMHRSGLRYVDEVAGRKGVLFGAPLRENGPDLAKQKREHPPQVTMTNTGKGAFLRLGVKGFGFPFLLKVTVGGTELGRHLVSEKQWSDLKIDLGENAGKPVEAVIELIVPENQKFSEGVWIDYLDFFSN